MEKLIEKLKEDIKTAEEEQVKAESREDRQYWNGCWCQATKTLKDITEK